MSEGILDTLLNSVSDIACAALGLFASYKLMVYRQEKQEEKIEKLETVQVELKDEQGEAKTQIARIEVRVEKIEEGDKKRDEKIGKLESLHISD